VSLSGQQAVFRGGVELVEVTVSVVDESGRAVTDLTIDDFEVRESGTPQTIALFDRVEIPLPPAVPEDAPRMPAVVADSVSNDIEENGRAFAIIVDDLQLLGWKTQNVRRLARQFVERHAGPNDLLLVLGTSGRIASTQEFTTDKARVLQAIDQIVGARAEDPGGLGGYEAPAVTASVPCEYAYQTTAMLDTVKALATHLSGIRRRRTAVLFISEGFVPDAISGRCPDTAHPTEKAIEALQQSNVTLYALDPYRETGLPSDGTRVLAEATGGYATVNAHPYTGRDFARIIQENSHYYLLGYYPTERRSEGQFRAIDVRVRRPGLRISNRPGYVYRTPKPSAPPRPATTRRLTPVPLAALLDYPLPTPGLPMRVQAIPLRQTDTRARVQVIVEVAGQDLKFEERGGRFVERIEFATVSFDEKARRSLERTTAVNLRLTAAERDRALKTGVRWLSIVELPRGRHDLRVAGHAQTSDLRGSVFIDVDVPRFDREMTTSGLAVTSLTAAQTFTTGSPILLPPLPSAPTALRTFPLGDVLAVSAEIYRPSERALLFLRKPGQAPTEFVVRVSHAAPPQHVVLEQPLPVMSEGHKNPYLSFAIDTKTLGAGRFVLRLARESGTAPADEAPGAVVFEVGQGR
jgi:VWFA-related protein